MIARGWGAPRAAAALFVLAAALGALLAVALAGCGGGGGDAAGSAAAASAAPVAGHSAGAGPKVTFVELGSDSCVPCKEMRPVMDGIQRTFGDQVEIVFFDVWEDDAPAREYGIDLIPTQVFLDEKGVEFHRHVGFYPQAEIEALLAGRGLEKLTTP